MSEDLFTICQDWIESLSLIGSQLHFELYNFLIIGRSKIKHKLLLLEISEWNYCLLSLCKSYKWKSLLISRQNILVLFRSYNLVTEILWVVMLTVNVHQTVWMKSKNNCKVTIWPQKLWNLKQKDVLSRFYLNISGKVDTHHLYFVLK